ncbi:MAG: PAS domain S-box protein [Candidatus Aminicenantales bacterium]
MRAEAKTVRKTRSNIPQKTEPKERSPRRMSYYRRIFEFSPEVIGLVDAEGNVLDVNKRVFDWLGFRPKEVIGKNFLQLPFLPEESKAKAKEKLYQALQNRKVPPYELDFLTKKGERRRGRVLVNPILNDGGNLMEILVMALDITDQKRAEEALQESEKKYRTLAESAKDGIYIISLDGFEYVNPAFERIIGYKAKEVCRKDFNFFDLIHPEDRTLIAKREEARKKGKRLPPIYSFRCLTKDGRTKHVEVHTVPLPGEKVKILGILRDITQRKKQEEALRESEELFRSIVENSHAGILIVDGAYKFVYVNDELCRIVGYPREEIIGQDFRKFLDEESRKLVAERYIKRQRGENANNL